MHIVEDKPKRLVLRDRTLWIGLFCAIVGGALALHMILTRGSPKELLPAALFALFGLMFMRSSEVLFDGDRHVAVLRRSVLFRTRERALNFDDIDDVFVDTMSHTGVSGNTWIQCRVCLSSKGELVPLSDNFEANPNRCDAMRGRIVEIVFAGRTPPPLADPVRRLVAAGRRMDAIALLRSRDRLGLAEAERQTRELEGQISPIRLGEVSVFRTAHSERPAGEEAQ